MPFERSLLQRESLLRVTREECSNESSGELGSSLALSFSYYLKRKNFYFDYPALTRQYLSSHKP